MVFWQAALSSRILHAKQCTRDVSEIISGEIRNAGPHSPYIEMPLSLSSLFKSIKAL